MVHEQGIEEWVPVGMRRNGGARERENGAGTDPAMCGAGTDPAMWIDLNAVDFEELLAMGIPIGQAARFISQRERRGGIRSVSEIDEYYGLVPGVRDILRSGGHVGS